MLFRPNLVAQTTIEDRQLLCDISDLLRKADQNIQKFSPRMLAQFRPNCHAITRAVYLRYGHGNDKLRLIDGIYLGLQPKKGDSSGKRFDVSQCSHSWLITNNGCIIDVYPVGVLSFGPLLAVDSGDYRSYASGHYFEDASVKPEANTYNTWRNARIILKLFNKTAP